MPNIIDLIEDQSFDNSEEIYTVFEPRTINGQLLWLNKMEPFIRKFYNADEIELIRRLLHTNEITMIYDPNRKNMIEYRQQKTVNFSECPNFGNFGNMMIIHHGQRKLAYSEIQCLTKFLPTVETPATIVYAGASPCTHLPILLELFPNTIWHLYDPSGDKYDPRLKNRDNVHLNICFFTDEIAATWTNKCDVFISDIRLNTKEDQIALEMNMQMTWAQLIKPEVSLLKYRPPYSSKYDTTDKFKYIDGTVYMQTRESSASTEGRLMSTKAQILGELVNHNYKHYESYCAEHNLRRVWSTIDFDFDLSNIAGYDRCLDCAIEVQIWLEFKAKYKDERPIKFFMELMTEITRQKLDNVVKEQKEKMTTKSGQSYHGKYANCPAVERVFKCTYAYCLSGEKQIRYIREDTGKHEEIVDYNEKTKIEEFKHIDNNIIIKDAPYMSFESPERDALFACIKLLTRLNGKRGVVLYITNCPNKHITLLCQLFPKLTFHLYSTKPGIKNINVYERHFSDEDADEWKKIKCDATIINIPIMSNLEEISTIEYKKQFNWVSSKLFLIKIGDNVKASGEMFPALRSRVGKYVMDGPIKESFREEGTYIVPNEMTAIRGFDRCYDCYQEMQILKEYDPYNVVELFNIIGQSLGDGLVHPPHGLYPDLTLSERIKKTNC